MDKMAIMDLLKYGHKNWQKGRFVKIYDKFILNMKKLIKTSIFIKTYGQNEF